MNAERGKFLVFEGVGGSGKSTQVEFARDYLLCKGHRALSTREPGGVLEAELIRNLIFVLKDKNIINADHQTAFFFAARVIWLEKLVIPSIEQGVWVLTDRCDTSTNAYQGYAEGGNRETIKQISTYVMGKIKPDAVFLLDICLSTFLLRRAKDANDDPFDKEPPEYHQRIIDGYREMAQENWGGVKWHVINGEPAADRVSSVIQKILDSLIAEK